MKSTVVNSLKMAYYVGGQGSKNILFIHGWASSGRMWLHSMMALRRQYRVWAIDLPGCGDSDGPELDWYSAERYADQVVAFCHVMGIKPYALIGHSMGGRIAFDLAHRYPDMVDRLVAVAPAITGRLSFNLDFLLAAGLVGKALHLSRQAWPLIIRSAANLYLTSGYVSQANDHRVRDDLRRVNPDAAFGGLRFMLGPTDSSHLAHISHPTLVICGKQDYTIPPGDSHLAARLLPHSNLLILQNIHHQVIDEALPTFVEAVQQFLNGEHPAA